MNDLDYLRLSKPQKFVHKLKESIVSLPRRLLKALSNLVLWLINLFLRLIQGIGDLFTTYIHGDWKTKISYTIMGFGSIARGQWLRGILFFAFQTVFNWYMFAMGFGFISKLRTLGTVETAKVNRVTVVGDNSFLILLYGVMSLFFVLAFLYTWYMNIKQNKMSEKLLKAGKKLKTAKDDVTSMLDGQFHKTLLALPTLGVTIFTILPIVFMILVAFTNFDQNHQHPYKLFTWIGTENFQTLLTTPETPVSMVVPKKITDTSLIQINASNGEIFTFNSADVDGIARANALTTFPAATLSKSKEALNHTGAFTKEKHTFQLSCTSLDPIEFDTDEILYSSQKIRLAEFITGKLTASFVPGENGAPSLLTLVNGEGEFVVLQITDDAFTTRITNRINGKSIALTLKDSIHANFTVVDMPANVTHQLIATKNGKTRKMAVTGYHASSAAVTVDSLMKQNATVTMTDGVVTIATQQDGQIADFIALTPANPADAQALLALFTPEVYPDTEFGKLMDRLSASIQTTEKDNTVSLSLLTFNKHRFSLEKDKTSYRVEGYALTSSDSNVTVESMAQRENAVITITATEDADGTTLLTITADNGDFVSLKTNQTDAAAALAAAAAPAENAEMQPEETGEAAAPAPITMTMTALPNYFDMVVFSDLGEAESLTVSNFATSESSSFSKTFRHVLLWTLIWAFFATFLNYFLGMLVAIMINKKGIKFKKLWRTILVMTIAIPQFISLLYVSKMFAPDGLINGMLQSWGWIKEPLPFWTNASWARITIIGINIWIGIPYLMLIATGILMNIPADLYESARIDGANAFQTYRKITLPYMLFVTGPYLLTSFTGNINNFNVIFLLSQGKPTGMDLVVPAGSTDLLITWLYKMTVDKGNYNLAAVIGILVFIVCAVINLIVYNLIPSVKNEEDFQ